MQEQPPSEQTKPESAEGARRRSPKATFTPPPTPAPPAQDPPGGAGTPRPRRAKAAPSVFFQPPPAPEQAVPAPEQASPRSAAAPPLTPALPFTVAPASMDEHPEARTDPAPNDPGGQSPAEVPTTSPTRKKVAAKPRKSTAKKAAPKKAVPEATEATPEANKVGPEATEATPERIEATPEATDTEPGSIDAGPARVRKTALRKVPAKKTAAAPAKANRARKATKQASPAASVGPDSATGEVRPGDTSAGTAEVELRALAVRVLDHPGFAPELLALAAVDALGPRAGEWARRLRETYPRADGDGLARLATQRFVRQAALGGATAALAGAFAPAVELVAVLWSQANLVLHVAAAYDRDPAHPERAAELLVLTRVHPDLTSARSALAAALAADGPGEAPGPRAVEAAWRLAAPLTAQAGGWLALRLVSRLLPGAAVLAAAAGGSAAAQRLAARAIAAYRPPRPQRPSSAGSEPGEPGVGKQGVADEGDDVE